MQKKAISEVISVVLIILVVIASIIIVWLSVNNMISNNVKKILEIMQNQPSPKGSEVSISTNDGLNMKINSSGELISLASDNENIGLNGYGGFYIAEVTNISENKILNPGFDYIINSKPDNWAVEQPTTWQFVDGYAKISSETITTSSSIEQYVSVKSNTKYAFSYKIKKQNCINDKGNPCSSGFRIQEYDENGKFIIQKNLVDEKYKDLDLTKLSFSFITEPSTVKIRIFNIFVNSKGTLFFDDVELKEALNENDNFLVKGTFSNMHQEFKNKNLVFTADYIPYDKYIRVNGQIEDLSWADRAFVVNYKIPFTDGWTWWDDIDAKRQISQNENIVYAKTSKIVLGSGLVSIYPFSSITKENLGLSYAIPLEQAPRIFKISYDNNSYNIRFYLATSPNTDKFPQKANFSFIIYKHDNEFGFRNAVSKYYEIFPDYFTAKEKEKYIGYNIDEVNKYNSLSNNINFGKSLKHSDIHVHSAYSLLQISFDSNECPDPVTYEETYGWLAEIVSKIPNIESVNPKYPSIILNFMDEERKIYATDRFDFLLNSVAFDAHNTPKLDPNYIKCTSSLTGLSISGRESLFRIYANPEAPGNTRITWIQSASQYLKNNEVVSSDGASDLGAILNVDCKKEHFKYLSFPLSFDTETLKPCIADNEYESSKFLSKLANEKNAIYYSNTWGDSISFSIPLVDIGMIETKYNKYNWNKEKEKYIRTIGGKKLFRYWLYPNTNDNAQFVKRIKEHLEKGLFYAIFPTFGTLDPTKIESVRNMYIEYIPLIEKLSTAGWEPLTYATCNIPIERFGNGKDIFFTIKNPYSIDKEYTIKIDKSKLGINNVNIKRWHGANYQGEPTIDNSGSTLTIKGSIEFNETGLFELTSS